MIKYRGVLAHNKNSIIDSKMKCSFCNRKYIGYPLYNKRKFAVSFCESKSLYKRISNTQCDYTIYSVCYSGNFLLNEDIKDILE